MTSQERILAVLRLEEPDRVPVIMFGINPLDREHWVQRDPPFPRVLEATATETDLSCRYNVELGFWGSAREAAAGLGDRGVMHIIFVDPLTVVSALRRSSSARSWR